MAIRQAPTHEVVHRKGWDARIHISTSVQLNLRSTNATLRDNARMFVCIRFRESCRSKFRDFDLDRIEWDDLTMIAIPWDDESGPADGLVVDGASNRYTMDPDGDECDDCPQCDLGDHHRCRGRNCPVVSR